MAEAMIEKPVWADVTNAVTARTVHVAELRASMQYNTGVSFPRRPGPCDVGFKHRVEVKPTTLASASIIARGK